MANWSGDVDATTESAGGGGGNFSPAPRGIYTIQVADFKDGFTKKTERPKVDLECEISDDGLYLGKKVWITITQIPKDEKGHGLMIHQLHAFGIELGGGPYAFDTLALQGQSARALLGVTTREKVSNGRTYINEVNFVEELYTEKHPEPVDGKLPAPRDPRASKPALGAGGAPGRKPAITKVFPGAIPAKEEEEILF